MDRKSIRGLVEDYWRTFIPLAQSGNTGQASDARRRFELRIEEIAALLPARDSTAFLAAVDAERNALLNEYESNPVALKRRLGIAQGVDASRASLAPAQTAMSQAWASPRLRATAPQSWMRLRE
jgi:hypothetical protein